MKDIENRVFKDKFYPELAITFLGGCEEQLLTEAVKKCLRECISSVSEVHFQLCFFSTELLALYRQLLCYQTANNI